MKRPAQAAKNERHAVTHTRAELLARALRDAGVGVVTCVPGAGATDVYDAWCALAAQAPCPSFHEEAAYAVAHGAALAGRRAAVLVKAHGLAKAGNAVVDSLVAGTTAGLVALVFEDPRGAHSDSILEAGPILRGFRIPFLAPRPADFYGAVLEAFARSEAQQLPVAVRIRSDRLAGCGLYAPCPGAPRRRAWRRNPAQHILCPPLAAYQQAVLEAKRAGRLWRRLPRPPLPRIPDSLPGPWAAAVRVYSPLFDAFRAVRGAFVAGDTGVSTLFAFPPYDCIDVCTCMGASLALAVGARLAGLDAPWAVTGDFSFLAAGQLGLLEAVRRRTPIKVLILNNRQARTTGGQRIPGGLLETVLEGFAAHVRVLRNPGNRRESEAALKEAGRAATLRIVVAECRE